MEKQSAMDDEILRKRLRYRSWHRGCKETDLILGRFADEKLGSLSPDLLNIYEKLLDENDADIWNWLTGNALPGEYGELVGMIKQLAVSR